MPQGPFQTQVLSNATKRTLNITANTVVKVGAGNIATISVVVAGTAAGSVHDASSVAGATAALTVAPIPAVQDVYPINFPVSTGIVIKPGAGQTLAISYT